MQMPKPLALNILIFVLTRSHPLPCLCFNELNSSYAAPSDVHGDAAHDVFQTIGPIVLITPAALDPKTRKPSALFRPAEIDATTRTNFTVGHHSPIRFSKANYGMCEAASSTTAARPATKYCVHIDNSRRRSF
jgi:hypothetical protein